MSTRLSFTAIVTGLFLHSQGAIALTVEDFSNICDSTPGACFDHPIIQAYVGGALDLLATLDEQTEYLDKLYCKEPQELFDVPTIVRFMLEDREAHAKHNAMLLVIRYFEANGGCHANDK